MSYVIKKPIMTEKTSPMAESGTYVFEVDRRAEKPVIKDHIERYFNVKIRSVRTAIFRRQTRKVRGRPGRVKYGKKAFVRLKAGEQISLFEGN